MIILVRNHHDNIQLLRNLYPFHFEILFILFDFRYFVVLSMHEALDDVYLTIGYMYNIPAIKIAE